MAVSRNTLRILALEKLGAVFNSVTTPLQYTPRRFFVDETTGVIVVAEGDHNIHDDESKRQALAAEDEDDGDDMALDEGELDEKVFGASKAGARRWSAAVSIVDPLQVLGAVTMARCLHAQAHVMFRQPLGNNEMVVSICKVRFAHAQDGAQYVLVGTVKDWQLNPKVPLQPAVAVFNAL